MAADPSQGDRERRSAELVLGMDALVISDSVTVDPADPWASHTRVAPRAEGVAEVERMKAGDGGDILMFGSGTTWNPLLEAGSADVLPGSQLVALRYAPA